jgi:flagellar hook-associated protein 1 FlgK
MLSYDPLDPARSITVAITNTDAIATAAAPGPPFATFDATIPENLADLRNVRVLAGGTATIGESYRSFVAALGQQTASALSSAVSQQGLVDSAERSRQSSHGVSVDEEMVHLMEAQRMYEAAARVITSVDQALDTLINRMGIVGR